VGDNSVRKDNSSKYHIWNGSSKHISTKRISERRKEETIMTTREEKRRADLLKSNKEVKKATGMQKDFEKGELVEATVDYITEEWPHPKPPKRYGIVLEPKTSMYSEESSGYATRVQWADNSEETVWQFEIQGVVRAHHEEKK